MKIGTMKEIYDRGWVLDKKAYKEHDSIITLFTEKHGKLRLRAQGMRKPKARLGGILQPLRCVRVRFIQKGTIHKLVDATLENTFEEASTYKRKDLLPLLQYIDYSTFDSQKDGYMWFFLSRVFLEKYEKEDMYRALSRVEGGSTSFPHVCSLCKKNRSKIFIGSLKNVACYTCGKSYENREKIPLSFFNNSDEVI